MRALIVTAIASSILAWSSPVFAERYQVLPMNTHNNAAKSVADHTALLMDTSAGVAFNCTAQFDTKVSQFTHESACIAVSLDGKPPSGQIAWQTAPQNFGWIPLWSVDQQSGEVTFCTARTTIQGVGQLWCTPVVTRK
jgi:hypothetical protein